MGPHEAPTHLSQQERQACGPPDLSQIRPSAARIVRLLATAMRSPYEVITDKNRSSCRRVRIPQGYWRHQSGTSTSHRWLPRDRAARLPCKTAISACEKCIRTEPMTCGESTVSNVQRGQWPLACRANHGPVHLRVGVLCRTSQ